MKKILSMSMLFASILSFNAFAAPELIAKSTLDFGDFEKTANIEIQGNIQEDVLRLAERGVQDQDADYFVIEQINEDTQEEVLVVSVSLYREHATDNKQMVEDRLG
ncbi:hypothetical protein BZG82_05125 [Salinivibrio sp. PR5]|uniref:hypothetical protein n=1 Tax=Salinivibrio sp. PR5 TaxID=1909484 RepID=UPI00098B5705|nr:hypothetical protein [Salinivibrio sp. PR5]OOF11177.1 hypothetical protein BZG82_05125 [Salinivibrio sp. PR5]